MNRWILTFLFCFSISFSFSQITNHGIGIPQFNMEGVQSTRLSSGTLFDSGGENGFYGSSENSTFTICPEIPHETINLEFEYFETEREADLLKIYDSNQPEKNPYSVVTGSGKNRNYFLPGGCITLEFKSDEYLTGSGFKMNWTTGNNAALRPGASDCDNPTVMTSLPFVSNNLTTCGAGNDYWITPCNSHLWAEDFLLAYDSPGDECVEVILSGADDLTSVSIYDDCPDDAEDCLAEATIDFFSSNSRRIPRVFFKNPGRYYFMVSRPLGCSQFKLEVNPVDCPLVFPSASLCEEALPITGCDLDQPSVITVQQGEGDDTFLKFGINEGCWKGFPRTNFTWFYVEAQDDGEFGFLLSSENSNEPSDIDIQVWGPITDLAVQCNFARNNQPIRSTFADEKASYDLTGLTNINPISNGSVNDNCEDEFGDGFVRALNVRKGEFYLILVNDYDGIINSGAVSIDFSPTSPGVLGNPNENFSVTPDTVLCSGDQLQLDASGGLIYRWLASPELSCLNCQNPIASPQGNSTYQVIIGGICEVDTLSVNVTIPNIQMPDDFAVCQNETPVIDVSGSGANSYSWTDSGGFLSCTDCSNPTAQLPDTPGFYTFEVDADFGNCSITESITIEVVDFPTPQNYIIENTEVCEGESIRLGATNQNGIKYSWRGEDGNLFSINSNPEVTPDSSQWYFISLDANGCSVEDSVFVELIAPPSPQAISPQTICPGDEVFLNPTGDPDLIYTWTDMDGNILSNEQNPNFSPTETTVFYLSVETSPACPSFDTSVTITVHPIPEISLTANDENICTGETVILVASSDIPGGQFTWNNSISGDSLIVTPSESTTYTLSYVDVNGCASPDDSIRIEVGMSYSIDDISITPDLETIYEGCELTFEPTITPDGTDLDYEWFVNNEFEGTDETLTYIFENEGAYSVRLEASENGGCLKDYELILNVFPPAEVKIPNIFSPNGDGINDYFVPFTDGKPVEVLNMVVFNRWGRLVYNNDDNENGWSGMFDGEEQPSDVYIYKVSILLPDGEEYSQTGDVTLYR